MELRHVEKHTLQGIHTCHIRYFTERHTRMRLSHSVQGKKGANVIRMESESPLTAADTDISFNADDSFMDIDDTSDVPLAVTQSGIPPPAAPVMVSDDMDSDKLSELMKKIIGHRTFEFEGGCPDLFAELQATLASGELPFSTPLSRSSDKEHELFDDSAPNFGVELPVTLPDDIHDKVSANFNTVSMNNPTYPWPSKAHFFTSLLFSSPRLPFSETQKKAILNWARSLGAQNVPSLGSMKKCHTYLDNLVGNPTQQVTSRAGDIFYINNITEVIAKFAMKDYPEDGGEGMLQVFNGKKMLLDLPSPPAVRVDGTIYFTDELLQDNSGDYFIPEHFFHASPPADSDGDDTKLHEHADAKPLYALGRAVERTEAGFIVHDEQEIIPTSTFVWSFEDIAATQGVLCAHLYQQSRDSHDNSLVDQICITFAKSNA
ncbi:uncharacterized protein F5147DRAFT_647271 [Suillus discolor]|uniref:Uncharacterized protein n=1 Tax=Suillus discolor TaxID=1912936 RepID=A0A9P7K0N4_9AGAM|nr:uncharacterized protein F5147DRAFT_647271 [Suillus discolor]KAG2120872.1 hypothetical protein F5147DRAFT_647271 [Suillus discolor]